MSTNNIFSYSQMEVHKKKYPRHHQVNNEGDAEENGEEPSVMRLNINDAVGIANSALNRGYVNTGGWHAAGPITPAFSTSDT